MYELQVKFSGRLRVEIGIVPQLVHGGLELTDSGTEWWWNIAELGATELE